MSSRLWKYKKVQASGKLKSDEFSKKYPKNIEDIQVRFYERHGVGLTPKRILELAFENGFEVLKRHTQKDGLFHFTIGFYNYLKKNLKLYEGWK